MSRAFVSSPIKAFVQSAHRQRNTLPTIVSSQSSISLVTMRAGFFHWWHKAFPTPDVPDPLTMDGQRYRRCVFGISGPLGSGQDEITLGDGTNWNPVANPIVRSGGWPVATPAGLGQVLSSTIDVDTATSLQVTTTYVGGAIVRTLAISDPVPASELYDVAYANLETLTSFPNGTHVIANHFDDSGTVVLLGTPFNGQDNYLRTNASHRLLQNKETTPLPQFTVLVGGYPPGSAGDTWSTPGHRIDLTKGSIQVSTAHLWTYRFLLPASPAELACQRDAVLNGILQPAPAEFMRPGIGYQQQPPFGGFVRTSIITHTTAFPPATWPYPPAITISPTCIPEFTLP